MYLVAFSIIYIIYITVLFDIEWDILVFLSCFWGMLKGAKRYLNIFWVMYKSDRMWILPSFHLYQITSHIFRLHYIYQDVSLLPLPLGSWFSIKRLSRFSHPLSHSLPFYIIIFHHLPSSSIIFHSLPLSLHSRSILAPFLLHSRLCFPLIPLSFPSHSLSLLPIFFSPRHYLCGITEKGKREC